MKKVLLLLCCWLTALGLSAATYPDIYIRGEEAGWDNPNENYKFKRDGSTYSIELESLNGNFKIADGSWGDVNHVYNGTISTYGTYTFGRNTGEVNAKASNLKNVRISFTFDVNNKQNALSVKFEQVENGGNEGGDEDARYYVFFERPSSWGNVTPYVWAWNNNGNLNKKDGDKAASFPGDAMTLRSDGLWFWEAPYPEKGEPANFIISKNGDNNDRFEKPFVNKATFTSDGNSSINTSLDPDDNGGIVTPPVGETHTVYFDNTNSGWSVVYCYAWTKGESDQNAKWPGVEMTKGDNNIYSYTTTSEYANLKFNCGSNSSVTEDLTWSDGKTYSMPKVDDTEYGEYYILFENSNNWSEPCVWAWDTTNNGKNCNADGTYPGDSMKKLSNGLWYWEVPSLFRFPNKIKISDRKNSNNATGDLTFYNKGTYKPNGSQTGGEIVTPPDVKMGPTGTLPVLYINVYDENGGFDNEIINKDLAHKNYFSNAEYWLDVKDCQWMIDEFGAKSIGLDKPLPLEIKARGNFTRKGYSKKPYKIKLGKKQNLLGLTPDKSKHYALLTHADDEFGYMRNFVGFRLGEMIGLPWTPKQQPIEVVINGDYRGIYFLTESIRVDDGRVPITELDDNVSDPALISGGYLVELDNYVDDCTFHMADASNKNKDGSYGHLMVTADTPEELSALQLRFIRDQFTKMNDLVNSTDDNELWSYLDMDDAARYYVVEEIISHYEAYHGSTYLYRNHGEGQKWHFTPLWDCGHAFDGPTDSFFPDMGTYKNPYTGKECTSYGNNWIGNYGNSKGLRSKTKFMNKVKNYFQWFINSKDNNNLTPYQQLCNELNAYVSHIKEAALMDAERWDGEDRPVKVGNDDPQDVVKNRDIDQDLVAVKDRLDKKINFLNGQWSAGSTDVPVADTTTPAELPYYAKETYKPKKFYIVNSSNWNNINVYMYNGKGDKYTEWYGDPADLDNGLGIKNATIDGTTYDVYSYIIWDEFAGEDTKVIFSNKGVNQYPGANSDGVSVYENEVFFTGNWNSTATADFPWSGKLPLVRITTPDSKKIGYGDKGQVKECSFAIDALGIEGYSDVFRSKAGDTSIKGRGKSWDELGKNSYKIKTDSKISILGMPKSKHWVLMPYSDDTENAMLTNYAGHEMASLLGLNWTPSMEPVEVIINGEYKGLYFIAENIRAAADRVPIADYGDDQANGDKLTYSKEHDFLFEIDADHDEADASELFYSWVNGDFTHKLITKTPSLEDIKDDKTLKNNAELLAATIDEICGHIDTHITEVQNAVKNAAANIYSEDWTNVIDAKQAAKYYIVQEIMDDARSFTNNFYMHHTYEDTNEGPAGTKWFFGPVWDFSGALAQDGNKSHLIHEVDNYDGVFIKDLYKNRQFVWIVGAIFHKFKTGDNIGSQVRRYANGVRRAPSIQDNFDPEVAEGNDFESALTSISNMAGRLQEAAAKDAEVWPDNASTSEDNDVAARADALIQKLRSNVSYLATNVNEGGAGWNANDITTGVEEIVYGNDEDAEPVYFDLMGRRVAEPQSGNIYVVRRGANVTKEVIR